MNLALAIMTAGGGFLLAVLWMDLMFDVQVIEWRNGEAPDAVLTSIAAYYHRATTTARPMTYLIALVMVILLSALAFRAFHRSDPMWLLITTIPLAAGPILLAATRTVPNAIELGDRPGTPREQTRLAWSICRDHLLCVCGILTFTALWAARSVVG